MWGCCLGCRPGVVDFYREVHVSFIMAVIEGDSRTITAESFRLEVFSSGSQLQSLGIGGDCPAADESEQTQLCGRSETISRCKPRYPVPYSPLKSSVSTFTSTSLDDPADIHCPFQTPPPTVTFEWPLHESQKDFSMSSAEGEKWMGRVLRVSFSAGHLS